jgi:hypothetical protein
MTLPVKAKMWLLIERISQQQEDDSKKRSSNSGVKDTTKTPEKDKNNSNIPHQYTKVKNSI